MLIEALGLDPDDDCAIPVNCLIEEHCAEAGRLVGHNLFVHYVRDLPELVLEHLDDMRATDEHTKRWMETNRRVCCWIDHWRGATS